jgi:TetR/AcrR family transcriptional regulator
LTVRSVSDPSRRQPSPRRGRRSRQHAARTRERIEKAALREFAEVGFDAASTREIAARARVNQQLVTYHFETKLGLWKAVADRIFAQLGRAVVVRPHGRQGVDEPARARLLIEQFVRFSVDHPEVARFMMHEGSRRGPRLEWLVERHVRPLFEAIRERIAEAQARGLGPAGDPIHIAYIVVGATALFSQAAEFELLTGRDARAPEAVEAHVNLLLDWLLSKPTRERVGGGRHE